MKSTVPTTALARRIAAIVHRKPTTPWDEKEIRVYKKRVREGAFEDLENLARIERYEAFERKKKDNGIHRRDLYTLLNKWYGEGDRALEHEEKHPDKPKPRKIIPLPLTENSEPYNPTPEDVERTEQFMAQYRARKKLGDDFRKAQAIMKEGSA